MSRIAPCPRSVSHRLRAVRLVPLGTAGIALAVCGLAGPSPDLYVLGALSAATTVTTAHAGLPVVEVKRVGMPDYLDTTDILIRSGDQVVPSRTGRWSERLSVGVTRAFATALAARLPRMMVTTTSRAEPPAFQVVVDIETFDARTDGQIVLVADWSVTEGTARAKLYSERASLVEAMAGTGDSAVAAAMTTAVEDLAGHVARIDYQPSSSRKRK